MTSIGVIGCGNIGTALLEGALRSGSFLTKNFFAVGRDASKMQYLKDMYGCQTATTLPEAISTTDIVLLAVKPQGFLKLAEELNPLLNNNQLVVSIMAGISRETLLKHLPAAGQYARCMPNLPISIGKGVVVSWYGENVLEERKIFLNQFFSSTAEVFEVEKEELIDAATALTATGPGCLYYIYEHIVQVGKEMGFNDDLVEILVKKLVVGSAVLWDEGPGNLKVLREAVTSKNGTTAAAIRTFDAEGLEQAIRDGFRAALERTLEFKTDFEK